MPSTRRTHWAFLGRVDYAQATRLQIAAREALRRRAGPERLLLLEHPPVYTLGRNATPADLLWSERDRRERGIEVHLTDRGGQVTYHGPGQLVGYPILDLDPDRRDLRRYVRDLQESLVRTLADFGIVACGGEGERIGVWVGNRKIASIGIHLSRWLTTHGFALNVETELGHFGGIVACGIQGVDMTSMARETGTAPQLDDLARSYCGHFSAIFARELIEEAPPGCGTPAAAGAIEALP